MHRPSLTSDVRRNFDPGCHEVFTYYERLRRVREYVEEHLADSISVEDAAGAAALEPSYFSTYFCRRVGVCFAEWLASFRVERAAQLLRSRECSIEHTTGVVGFGSTRTFQRWFKRYTGLTPCEYRRLHRPAAHPGLHVPVRRHPETGRLSQRSK